jgi:hypothetical protein
MAHFTSTFSFSDIISSRHMLDAIQREVYSIKAMTVYQSPMTANMLIRWELSEFDPYFVHEDF